MEPRTVLVNTCDPVCPPPPLPRGASPRAPARRPPALADAPPQKKLTYECLCGNKQQPNMSEYTLSLPYFICQEWGNQCVPACKGDNTCEADCREKHPCGATAPKKYNATSTTSAGPSATQTEANTIYSDRPGGGAGSSGGGSSGAPAALEFGRSYGLAAVMVGLFGGFALL